MHINRQRRTLLRAFGFGLTAPLWPTGLAFADQPAAPGPLVVQAPPETAVAPGAAANSLRMFRLNPAEHRVTLGPDLEPFCLAFGPRAQRTLQMLWTSSLFGCTQPSEITDETVTGVTATPGCCDWLALIIDAQSPGALAAASAAARDLADRDIYLRFALILEDQGPPDPTQLTTLSDTLDGVVLLEHAPAHAAPAEVSAALVLEHFLLPPGLVGIDISDVRHMLRQGFGMHRALSAPCTASATTETLQGLVAGEPIAQAQVAMAWAAAGFDYRLEEYSAMYDALEALAPRAYRLAGMGISEEMDTQARNLLVLWG
ncbi:hypothetical protein CKO42_08325 [Lamprobacter modestohalophilus]|uniref:Uncharacterized protein n=1 Tax=Lamprobacter modestohalophilus TaxID=1064514 RepID=A0A9X0W7T3_9GAMM|nr:hypothetical protein [Lamprobacter modestohalophilus]MBK1618441.1 hypothetical protein [Lamprobacter modestohalophilus]